MEKLIDGVKVKSVNGKVELHIPRNFDGQRLQEWKDKNAIELKEFKNSLKSL